MGISRYHYLIDEYYRAWFFHHPEQAVDIGVEGYADRLAPYGDDEHSALIRLHEKLLDAIDEMDVSALDEDQRIDVELMRGQASIEREELLLRDSRLLDPSRYLPVNAIYQLTIRQVQEPEKAFRARLSQIPEYLRGARHHLLITPEAIPAEWLQGAVTEAQAGAAYFRQLTHHPHLASYNIDTLLEQAALALEEFSRFLQSDIAPHARGSCACGRDLFEDYLQFRHGLDISVDELHHFGQRLFDRTLLQLRDVTKRLRGDEDFHALSQQIQQQHQVSGDLLVAYREQMQAARSFLQTHDLVSMPEPTSLSVIATPEFLRHRIPFAAYVQPMPTDTQQRGLYYVTVPRTSNTVDEHNRLELQHTCVHEAWPGHHLQFVTANRQSRSCSVPRLINASASMYEGWALYSEQLMWEQGFLASSYSEFILLKDRLWRALRILIDIEIHTQSLSLNTASQRMQQLLGFSPEQADGEVFWYSQSPSVPLGYATGWALINAARDELVAQDQTLELKRFHDNIVSAGSIGLPWVMRRVFGDTVWQRLRNKVFFA